MRKTLGGISRFLFVSSLLFFASCGTAALEAQLPDRVITFESSTFTVIYRCAGSGPCGSEFSVRAFEEAECQSPPPEGDLLVLRTITNGEPKAFGTASLYTNESSEASNPPALTANVVLRFPSNYGTYSGRIPPPLYEEPLEMSVDGVLVNRAGEPQGTLRGTLAAKDCDGRGFAIARATDG